MNQTTKKSSCCGAEIIKSKSYNANLSTVFVELCSKCRKESPLSIEEEDVIQNAIKIILDSEKASAVTLQRFLGVGYAKAANILDILEKRGLVGKPNGAIPREILIKKEEPQEEKTEGGILEKKKKALLSLNQIGGIQFILTFSTGKSEVNSVSDRRQFVEVKEFIEESGLYIQRLIQERDEAREDYKKLDAIYSKTCLQLAKTKDWITTWNTIQNLEEENKKLKEERDSLIETVERLSVKAEQNNWVEE